jgi:hypothetical protein
MAVKVSTKRTFKPNDASGHLIVDDKKRAEVIREAAADHQKQMGSGSDSVAKRNKIDE